MKRLITALYLLLISASGSAAAGLLDGGPFGDILSDVRRQNDEERRIEENTRRKLEEIDRQNRERREENYRRQMLFEMQEQNRILREQQYRDLRNERNRIREILEDED
jgi:glucosamine 6-phosphate synthetase-like amidotransferase/phosphosugar isomerase protein